MHQPPPAQPGMREDEVETPALLIDLDAFEYNLSRMAALLSPTGVRLRAHAKTHKSTVIAQLQLDHGAIGHCVQKVAEAEALAWGGARDILVSNEIVGGVKLARLAALGRIARISVCADNAAQIAAIEAAAGAAGVRIQALVEIDVGAGRCGVAPGIEAAMLAERIAASPHLTFGGLQAYHGGAQHMRDPCQRKAAVAGAVSAVMETTTLLRRKGLDCPIVSGGGTGTFALEAASGVYTEVQAGSYIFLDADYGRNLDEEGLPVSTFRNALFVLASVMSAPRRNVAVLDTGLKALAVDSGMPLVWNRPGVRYARASDEHGELEIMPETAGPALGEKLRLIPGHCDPTVDHYDWYVGVRHGRVECLWPVSARGGMY